MRILIDAQLPPGLVPLLARAGHDAVHVANLGLRDATDTALWDRAVQENAVICTKDEDFALRRLRRQAGPTIVWLRVGNASNPALRRWLPPLLPQIEQMVARGEVLIEVR